MDQKPAEPAQCRLPMRKILSFFYQEVASFTVRLFCGAKFNILVTVKEIKLLSERKPDTAVVIFTNLANER